MLDLKQKEKMHKKIKVADVVSFDIFETAIIRTLKTREAFFSSVNKLCNKKIKDFKNKRINAEKKARKTVKNREITLSDIYDNFDEDNEVLSKYREIEIKLEENLCVANPDVYDLYKYALDNKKRIIFTSDMYLDKNIINVILHENNYKNYTNVYVSSDIGLTKSSGKLYEYVIKREKTTKIFHIGNNFKSDCLMAKTKGLNTFYYNYKSQPVMQSDILSEALILAFGERSCKQASDYYEFGYKILGPAILGYVSWILTNLKEAKVDKVFFFSREGKFIKRAFDCLYHPDIEEKYIYVSRRSLTVPALASVNELKDFLAFRPIKDNVTVKEELGKLGLTIKNVNQETWFTYNMLSKKLGSLSEKDKKALENNLFLTAKKYAIKELKVALEYLKQEGVRGKFAVVDIGWNGSMQRALEEIFKSNNISVDMIGYFLAQRDEFYKNKDYIKNYGYLFNYDKVSKKENLLLNSGTAFLELLFSADHGSTLRYKKQNNKVVPVFDKYEYNNIWPYLKQTQNGAIDFVKNYVNSCHDFKIKNEKAYFLPFYSVLRNPSLKIIDDFGNMNISDMNEYDLKIAPKLEGKEYLSFISKFKDSTWKVAFLKRNLRTNHAFEIYSFLRKHFN